MTDLLLLEDTLNQLLEEMQTYGMGKCHTDRVVALTTIIPNIEHARERKQ